MATEIGRLGVRAGMDGMTADEASAFVRQIEGWGYSAAWLAEAFARDPFPLISYLATQTQKLVFATGIANIYARDAMAMNAVRKTLGSLAPGRVVLGLGVSHGPVVSGMRGHEWGKPVSTMRNYLDAMDEATFMGLEPDELPPILIGALRPKMLGLAAERTRGAHPYLTTAEHTRRARDIMGPDAWLCPEQMVCRTTDPTQARTIARGTLQMYMQLPNYVNNLRELDFDDSDFQDGGSDRLIDAMVAWGDEKTIRERIQAHWDAGATHVVVHTFRLDGQPGADLELLEMLAPSLSK